jgi:hypothetical protein
MTSVITVFMNGCKINNGITSVTSPYSGDTGVSQ